MHGPAQRENGWSSGLLLVALAALAGAAAAVLAGGLWFPLGPIIGYSTVALLVAMTAGARRWIAVVAGCVALASCVVVAWMDLAPPTSRYVMALLAVPALGSIVAVSRYVAGTPELLAVEQQPRHWRRAAITSGVVACLGFVVWGSVLLGLRAERMDRVDESVDRINAGLSVIAEELVRDTSLQSEPTERPSRDTLVHGALTTGRSLVLLGRSGGDQWRLVAAALWSREPRIHINYVERESDVPPQLLEASVAFANRPEDFQRAELAWRYGSGDLPVGRPVSLDASDGPRSRAGEFNVEGVWTADDPYVLLSLSALSDQWWNEQGQRDYLRSAVLFFSWIHVFLVTVSMVMMTALDSRSGLLASLHAEQQRAALRRDAHDRVYNRLAAIAHTLETGEGDRAIGRNASFEIRSAVTYLQRILQGEEGQQEAARPERDDDLLIRQLSDICESAKRLWGTNVSLSVETDAPLDPRSSWDIQCVVDEALSNAGEHGRASSATVEVRVADGRARIVVHDNGTWVGNSQVTSTGLSGIRERLTERGGFISVETDPSGTTVRAELLTGMD